MEIVKFFSPLPRVPWNGSKGFKRLGTKGTSKAMSTRHKMRWRLGIFLKNQAVLTTEKKKKSVCVCVGGRGVL